MTIIFDPTFTTADVGKSIFTTPFFDGWDVEPSAPVPFVQQFGSTIGWQHNLGPYDRPALRFRSEAWCAAPSFKEGDATVIQFDLYARLGPAAMSNANWHVFMQSDGVHADGSWTAGCCGLKVQGGRWMIGGGGSGKTGVYTKEHQIWPSIPIDTFVDNQWHTWTIWVIWSSDPNVGSYTVRIDDIMLGSLYTYTMYPDQAEISVKFGLYRTGTVLDAQRAHFRNVTFKTM